ncbi:MAG: cytochrome c oxidase subunit 3 [Alphaproteobacteria bacterium]|nr:cytochrome c oxidase subunit 3 [Alphaproteobacteria bacterium]OJV47654.1 MAG: cytochrome c oxidase subunit 3 [Alphaproteobacteria bacterium 43-37]
MAKNQAHEIKKHPYHLVKPSPWPFVSSLAVLVVGIGAVLFMHEHGPWILVAGTALLLAAMIGWWVDVFKEGDIDHEHTLEVQRGLKIGMALFIISEVMFFVAFFWSYFHSSFNPTEVTGGVWPPKGLALIDPFSLPYLNTLILLLSGTTVTWAHHALIEGDRKGLVRGLGITILLGLIFTTIQIFEYAHATFAFKGGIYPSNFYMATGFHGFHVLIGTIFLIVCWVRVLRNKMTTSHHISFEAAAWYWHFVDVVWLFLFVSIYWWSYK